MHRLHFAPFLLFALLVAACEQAPEMPQQMRGELTGVWKQTDGPSLLRFYEDGTVMLRLADRSPPLNFLSTFELMKDGRIGIASGQVWLGPIVCEWAEGATSMKVTIPDKEKHAMFFEKAGG